MELEACRDTYNWLIRSCPIFTQSSIFQRSTAYRCLYPIPPGYINNLDKRSEVAREDIFLPPLNIILKIRYPLPSSTAAPTSFFIVRYPTMPVIAAVR